MGAGLAPANYIASQGTAINRAGRVHLERDAQGNYRLFNQGGQMLVSQGSGAQLKLTTQPAPIPVAGATQSASGALVVAGSRGARTLSILEP